MASSKQSKKRRKARAKRQGVAAAAGDPAPEPARPARAPEQKKALPGEDRPPPIWGNIPVTQLAVLGGIFLLVFGMIKQNPKLVIPGLALGSVGGLELSLREHFTGYRSHTTLLGGIVFVVTVAVTYLFAELILWQCLAIGLVLAIPAWYGAWKAFEHKSGGLNYRIR